MTVSHLARTVRTTGAEGLLQHFSPSSATRPDIYPWRTYTPWVLHVRHRNCQKRQTEASRPGIVTLGEKAERFAAAGIALLEVSCNRCERRGRLSIARLLAEHGPELRRIVAADCPRMIAGKVPHVCGVHFPQMSRLPTPFTNLSTRVAHRGPLAA